VRRGAWLGLALSLAACTGAREKPSYERGLIILGVDGMDPVLLQKYMEEGKTPNLKAMAERGSFGPLGTSNPPQSPVAWSTFTTGLDSGGHGIYDFVHRDPQKLLPILSTSKTESPRYVCLFGKVIPFGGGGVELMRKGAAFWQTLGEHGVPSTVVKVAANFPPPEADLNETLSGMGTPDALGTPGTFQVYTEDPELGKQKPPGGIVHNVDFEGKQTAVSELTGPPFDLCEEGKVLSLPLKISRDLTRPVALIEVDGKEILLAEKEWSDWIPVSYDGSVPGIVRFYLRQVRPTLHLYASPVNIDPEDPLMPISNPASYASEMADAIGRFYTKEMEPDTKALAAGVLSEEEFLAQVNIVFDEHLRMLHRELDRFRGGLLFFYFSEIDQLSHVYFRALDPEASEHDKQYAWVIPDLYARVDAAVGEVVKRYGDKYDILVMSDHGFAPYKKKVDLNTWLAERGYLVLKEGSQTIDWKNTQAYAMGLNGLYVNQKGREAEGVVPEDEKEILLRRITQELLELTDPEDRTSIVTSVVAPPVGAFADRAPDLLVGYNKGYRSSDGSAQGLVGGEFLTKNTDKWSGDHCIDPAHVPGVVLSTRKIDLQSPTLANFASTVLQQFEIPRPDTLKGESLWQKTK
jgi:predicted AlkP superfamily phosphohydrolase/phosphomutase